MNELPPRKYVQGLLTESKEADEALIALAPVIAQAYLDLLDRVQALQSVHARYFDLDETPGDGDSCPEPEDVWRFDRDFRAALGGDYECELLHKHDGSEGIA